MSPTANTDKKALRTELGLKGTVEKTLEDEQKQTKFEATNILGKQVESAVAEHYDARETNYQDISEYDDYDDLELTADKLAIPLVASRKNENDGFYMNMQSRVNSPTSTSTYTTPLYMNWGGGSNLGNYNAFGQRNTVDVYGKKEFSVDKWKDNYTNSFQYHPQRFYGNISTAALTESLGYPGMKKFNGSTYNTF